MLEFHMPHVYVHERCSGKEMVRFRGNKRDLTIGVLLAQVARSGNSGYSISYDDDMHEANVGIISDLSWGNGAVGTVRS